MNKKFDHTMVLYPSKEARARHFSRNDRFLNQLENGEPFTVLFLDNSGDGIFYFEKDSGRPSLYYALVVLADGSTLPYPVFEYASSNSFGAFTSDGREKYRKYRAGHIALVNTCINAGDTEREAEVHAQNIEYLYGIQPVSARQSTANLTNFISWLRITFSNQFVAAGGCILYDTKRQKISHAAQVVRRSPNYAEFQSRRGEVMTTQLFQVGDQVVDGQGATFTVMQVIEVPADQYACGTDLDDTQHNPKCPCEGQLMLEAVDHPQWLRMEGTEDMLFSGTFFRKVELGDGSNL